MKHPLYVTDTYFRDMLTLKERMAQFEQTARTDEQHSMEMLAYLMVLGITCTACLLAWVLW